MEDFLNQKDITNSSLYKKNLKIHKNLWKLYAFSLSLCIIFILIKGF